MFISLLPRIPRPGSLRRLPFAPCLEPLESRSVPSVSGIYSDLSLSLAAPAAPLPPPPPPLGATQLPPGDGYFPGIMTTPEERMSDAAEHMVDTTTNRLHGGIAEEEAKREANSGDYGRRLDSFAAPGTATGAGATGNGLLQSAAPIVPAQPGQSTGTPATEAAPTTLEESAPEFQPVRMEDVQAHPDFQARLDAFTSAPDTRVATPRLVPLSAADPAVVATLSLAAPERNPASTPPAGTASWLTPAPSTALPAANVLFAADAALTSFNLQDGEQDESWSPGPWQGPEVHDAVRAVDNVRGAESNVEAASPPLLPAVPVSYAPSTSLLQQASATHALPPSPEVALYVPPLVAPAREQDALRPRNFAAVLAAAIGAMMGPLWIAWSARGDDDARPLGLKRADEPRPGR